MLLSCRRCESNGCIVIVASFLSYFGCVEIAVLIVAPRADLADATPARVESIREFWIDNSSNNEIQRPPMVGTEREGRDLSIGGV